MMRFIESINTVSIFESEAHRLVATKAHTYKGQYWSVDLIKLENNKPSGTRKLGTRCTWDQVLGFVNQY